MKTLKQIREQYDQITHKQEHEERKLSALVDSGLMESKKLSLIKRAMNENNRVLTPSEKNAVMHLLESLIDNVVSEELRPATTRMSDMPSILVLKRKAIRVYPGGQNVGLYYSQQIDRYVAVPFDKNKVDTKGVLSMMEEHQLDEISNQLAAKVYAKRQYAADTAEDDEDKALHTYKAGKTLVNRMAKRGVPATLKMRKQYKQYKKDKDAEKAAKKASEPKPSDNTKPAETPKKPNVDMNVMNSNAAVDALRYGKLSHVIGGIGYRMLNKHKLKEEALDEGKLGDLIKKGWNKIRGPKKPKKPKKDRDVDVEVNNNDEDDNKQQPVAQQSGKHPVPNSRYSPTGGPSRLKINVRSNVFDIDRNMRYNKTLNTVQPQRQVPGQMMRENVEVDLDGNKFQLNNIVATKVQSVYESLNKTNKKKMIDMLNESEESFNKVISFVVRH